MAMIKVRISLLDKRNMYMEDISGEKFLQYNPPCKECLMSNMCLTDYHNRLPRYDYIMVRYCGELKKFLNNSKWFYYSKV